MKTINPEIIFSKGYNPKTVFLTEYKDIEGRLDPLFYSGAIFGFVDNVKFPLMTIAEISDYIKTGFAVGREAQADDDEEKYIQIRPTNIGDDGTLKFEKNVYIGSEYLESKKDQILSIGDVLFNNTNSQELVGKTSFFDVEGIFFSSNHITRIKTKEQLVLPEFLCWVLNYYQRNKVFFNICTNWNNQSGVGNELLRKIKIPVPPIEIQKKAIEKISTSNQKRSNAKADYFSKLRIIDNHILKTLGITLPEEDNTIESRIFKRDFKLVNTIGRLDPKRYCSFVSNLESSIRNDNFPKKKLSELIIHSASGDWGIDEDALTEAENYQECMVIRSTEFDNDFNLNIENDRLKYRYILKTKLHKLDVQPNDILIEKSGGSEYQPVGRVAIIEKEIFDNYTLCYSNFIHKIRIDENQILPEYLFYYLKVMHNIKYTDVMQSQTNGIRNLIMKEFFAQEIPLPKKEIQMQLISEISSLYKQAKQNLGSSEQLSKTLLNEIETLLKS